MLARSVCVQTAACSVRDGCSAGQLMAKCVSLASFQLVVVQLERDPM